MDSHPRIDITDICPPPEEPTAFAPFFPRLSVLPQSSCREQRHAQQLRLKRRWPGSVREQNAGRRKSPRRRSSTHRRIRRSHALFA